MAEKSSRDDYGKISPTAKITAYWRSFSDIPYSKEIAEAVDAEKTAREMLGDRIAAMGLLSPSIFEVRYKSINDGLRRSGIDRIMELASGLSPRGLDIASRGGVYVGSDLPDMHAESGAVIRAIASRAGVPTANLHLQPANVLSRRELEEAASHFNGARFAVCNEGLMTYLDMEEKATMAGNIREILLSSRGCWITTDIQFQELRESLFALFGPEAKKVAQPVLKRISERTGRDITGNDFADKAEALKFFDGLGFAVEEYPLYAGDYPLSTASILPESFRDRVVGIFSSAKAWKMAPKP